jgi:23S rRNA (uracil1939-C5)-methyltransferase
MALLDEKYEVVSIQPVDMFPHTAHVESMAVFDWVG